MQKITSIQAYNEIKENGLLSIRQFQVYHILVCHGPLSGGEIWHNYLKEEAQIDSIRPRLAELERLGVITAIGEKVSPITGKTVILWNSTGNIPIKLEKKIPNKRKLELYNSKLQVAFFNAVEGLKRIGTNDAFQVIETMKESLK